MEQSANLQLPYIMPSQAQKHVTHNEAIRTLDALVQPAALDRDLSTPPVSPADGDRYLVAPGGADAWAGKDGKVAAWQDGAWAFLTPRTGWLLWIVDEDRLIGFDGAAWIDAAVHSVNPSPLVGVNATADATNRLAVKSPASLFDEEAGDHRLKINKAAAGDTASLVFQSGYSGRAEFGLAGDDDWHVKVSADGAAWTEALKVDRATGRVSLPAALSLSDENQVVAKRHVREKLTANRTYHVRTDGSDGNDGLTNTAGGAFLTVQKAVDVARSLDLSIYQVTISFDGTFAENVVVGPMIGGAVPPLKMVGSGYATAKLGNAGIAFQATGPVEVHIGGFTCATGTHGVQAVNGANVRINQGTMSFEAMSGRFVDAGEAGRVTVDGDIRLTGNAPRAFYARIGGYIGFGGASSPTIHVPNNITCSTAFMAADRTAMFVRNATVTFDLTGGSVTGKRYAATGLSLIDTAGGGATFFPGTVDGTVASGSQYL